MHRQTRYFKTLDECPAEYVLDIEHLKMVLNSRSEERFALAIQHAARTIIPMHLGQRVINKIFGQAMQSHAAGLIVIMHCEALLEAGPRPTLSAVQQKFHRPRTLATFVSLLKYAGFVAVEEDPFDKRVKFLVPQAPLVNGLRDWLVHHLHCAEIAGIELATKPSSLVLAEPDFDLHFIARTRPLVDRTRDELQKSHAWAWFDRYDCGDRIALMLLSAHYDSRERRDKDTWFARGADALAEQIGVSRSHVHNVLNAAGSAGYLRLDPDRGRMGLTPLFLAEAQNWHYSFWSWLAEAFNDAALNYRRGTQP